MVGRNHESELSVRVSSQAREQLQRRALATGTDIGEVASRLLETALFDRQAEAQSPAERVAAFDAWMSDLSRYADRYPPRYKVDHSREAIYDGRNE